ncbi:thiolase domain-containing protein [Pseudarthrobacter sp. NIBRBAC000502772]|uniref:thiolase C-terminal domain-containing protein n=1 Tax=Pseudarthrobacter sp. NIBRBAC000502772 TaxID=2590775 RepID=UPI001FEFC3AB|nr:thiolase domain-containing protein [Pseudarthrobacter sp. NIBRBAC000502772]
MSAAIVGLGMSQLGKVFGRTSMDLAGEAVVRAVTDAGLRVGDLDGLLLSGGMANDVTPHLAIDLGLTELNMLAVTSTYGASAGAMVAAAARAISDGTATAVACVFADTPLKDGKPSAWGSPVAGLEGYRGWNMATGAATPNVLYAMAARRHMEIYGTTTEQFAEIAVAQRAWAAGNPLAQYRDPITVEDHHASPWIADPLRRLDCCLVSNGAIAVVVTSTEFAADLAQPPVHVWGYGEGHRPRRLGRDSSWGLETGATASGRQAMARASITTADVDVVELYDCYTYTVLVTLEDYGFCAKGEGGAFVEDGRLAPGGTLAVNTGGGQLSSYYMWGYTPLSEAIIQVRGHGGARQAPRSDIALVSGNGGILEFHSTLILGKQERNA